MSKTILERAWERIVERFGDAVHEVPGLADALLPIAVEELKREASETTH